MAKTLTALFQRFSRDTRANVAMIFALCVGVIGAATGGALDYSRAVAIGSELQAALDSGVLAAASLTQDRQAEQVVRAYVEAAISDHGDLIDTLELNVSSQSFFNSREVSASANLTMPTTLLGLAGVNTLTVNRRSSAIEQVRDIEISLVLDISGSMAGTKIEELRAAAADFIDVVLLDNPDRTSLSIIPYNGGVRLPRRVLRRGGLVDRPGNQLGGGACLDHGETYPIEIDIVDQELPILTWDGVEMVGDNESSHCPERNEQSVFLSNDRENLKRRVDRLDAGGNTGLDVATAWGARALDPAWRGDLGGDFADRPAAYDDDETIKVLVVMTDGAATAQYRRVWRSGRWRDDTLYNAATARSNMASACDEAEGKGVQIYTIAFQLEGETNRNLMRNCASDPDNYFQIENTDIGVAFAAIAADINRLRLTD
jgi:Flp pilus assembly protein TadG